MQAFPASQFKHSGWLAQSAQTQPSLNGSQTLSLLQLFGSLQKGSVSQSVQTQSSSRVHWLSLRQPTLVGPPPLPPTPELELDDEATELDVAPPAPPVPLALDVVVAPPAPDPDVDPDPDPDPEPDPDPDPDPAPDPEDPGPGPGPGPESPAPAPESPAPAPEESPAPAPLTSPAPTPSPPSSVTVFSSSSTSPGPNVAQPPQSAAEHNPISEIHRQLISSVLSRSPEAVVPVHVLFHRPPRSEIGRMAGLSHAAWIQEDGPSITQPEGSPVARPLTPARPRALSSR